MPSGAPDTSFAGDGLLTMDTVVNEIVDLVVQPDGKVVMVGAGGPGFVVMRLSADGTLDESFGPGGIVLTKIGDPAYRDSAGANLVAQHSPPRLCARPLLAEREKGCNVRGGRYRRDARALGGISYQPRCHA